MFHHLSRRGQQAISGYAAGVEKRIQQVRANPSLLPGEYALLSTLPADWTVEDTHGRRGLHHPQHREPGRRTRWRTSRRCDCWSGGTAGSRGRAIFFELFPDDEPNAAVTIPDRTFSNLPAGDRSAADQARDASACDELRRTKSRWAWPRAPAPATPPVPERDRSSPEPTCRRAIAARSGVPTSRSRTGATDLHGGQLRLRDQRDQRTRTGHAMLVIEPAARLLISQRALRARGPRRRVRRPRRRRTRHPDRRHRPHRTASRGA